MYIDKCKFVYMTLYILCMNRGNQCVYVMRQQENKAQSLFDKILYLFNT